MKKRGLICLAILLILIIGFYFLFNPFFEKESNESCVEDKDCVPSSCCHAEKCVSINNSKNCSGIYCTQECSSPLDCGAGKCGCVKEKCEVVKNE